MKKSRFSESRLRTRCGWPNRERQSSMSAGRSACPSHVLHVEEEIRGPRRDRAATAEDARGRELAIEADRGRLDARQADPARGRPKKALKAAKRRELAAWMQERFRVSVRRSCRLALLRPSVWYAKSQARDQSALRQRIPRVQPGSTSREAEHEPAKLRERHEVWSMAFLARRGTWKRPAREGSTVVDDCSKEAVQIADTSMPALYVTRGALTMSASRARVVEGHPHGQGANGPSSPVGQCRTGSVSAPMQATAVCSVRTVRSSVRR